MLCWHREFYHISDYDENDRDDWDYWLGLDKKDE